jgi:DNA-directed RNA polymerase beta subunit
VHGTRGRTLAVNDSLRVNTFPIPIMFHAHLLMTSEKRPEHAVASLYDHAQHTYLFLWARNSRLSPSLLILLSLPSNGGFGTRRVRCSDDIPILVMLKAMGVESDQEVVQMIGTDPQSTDLLAPSIQECCQLSIFTQQQALEYMGSKVKTARSSWVRVKKSKVDEVRDILAAVVLAHVPVRQFDFRTKIVYTCVMIRRMLHVRSLKP